MPTYKKVWKEDSENSGPASLALVLERIIKHMPSLGSYEATKGSGTASFGLGKAGSAWLV